MDLLTTVMHELGHVLGYDDHQAQRHRANLMTETLPSGVRRSLPIPALNQVEGSGRSDHSPWLPSPFTPRTPFTPAIPLTGNGSGTPTKPMIDWTEIDEHDSRSKKGALGASPQKASWLQRFLFHLGQDDAKQHDHGIEVVLSGKKK